MYTIEQPGPAIRARVRPLLRLWQAHVLSVDGSDMEAGDRLEDVLLTVDPACGELRDVPLGMVINLARRGLIEANWKGAGASGRAPRTVSLVRLSETGRRMAIFLQKLRPKPGRPEDAS